MKDYENFVERMGSFDMDLTTTETDQDVLNHFGVKGMKWGVRKKRDSGGPSKRRQNRNTRKADKEWAGNTQKRMGEIINESSKRTAKQQSELLKELKKSDVYKRALAGGTKESKELENAWTREQSKIIANDIMSRKDLVSPSGNKRVDVALAVRNGNTFIAPRIVDVED